MANTITDLMPKLLAQGLLSLREKAIYPKYVNTSYSSVAAEKGQQIEIPTGSVISSYDVAPAAVPPQAGDSTMSTTKIVLDTWKGAAFYLTDKQIGEIDPNKAFLQVQTSSAIRSIANAVNSSVALLYKDVYGYAGTGGTTPFASDVSAATATRKVLENQLCPMDDGEMALILDPNAEANALNLAAFSNAQAAGNADVVTNARLGRKYGFDIDVTTTVPTHTAGTGASYLVNGALTAGATTVVCDGGTGTIVVGDIVTFAGNTQTYAVKTALASNSFTISPALTGNVADNAAITVLRTGATYVNNIAFHKEAFGLAIRPTAATDLQAEDRKMLTIADDVSGIAMTLEVSRQYKQWMWEFSILYGAKTIRPEYACRLLG